MASNFATAEILAAPIDVAAELWASSAKRTADAFAGAEEASTSAAPNQGETPRAVERTMRVESAARFWFTADRGRKWLWWSLAALVAGQFYFVRELAAAFGIFVLAFAAVAGLIIGLYMLLKSWELALARIAAFRRPVLQISPVPHDHRKPA